MLVPRAGPPLQLLQLQRWPVFLLSLALRRGSLACANHPQVVGVPANGRQELKSGHLRT